MARQESVKEDLIRDATALVERAELMCDGHPERITIGFFRDGRMAVYFDQDPFYQFDTEGRLRRAFEDGFLYRSQGLTLARLKRRRTSDEPPAETTILERLDLDQQLLRSFQARMSDRLTWLHHAIQRNQIRVTRAVSCSGGIPEGALNHLQQVLNRDAEFLSPQLR